MSLTPEQKGDQVEDTHPSFRKHPFLDVAQRTAKNKI